MKVKIELNNGIAPDENPISDYIVVECNEADEDLELSYSIKKNARVGRKRCRSLRGA